MKVDILTLFPEMFKGPFDESILKRAREKSLVEINVHDLRGWAKDKHKMVDDRPFGGGPGMVLMVEPIYRALKALKLKVKSEKLKVILLDAAGKTFNQKEAEKLSKYDHLILIAGHYKGIDQRVKEHLIDAEVSIGDYVLTGGEIPAMVVVDAVVRLIPEVIGKSESLKKESFSDYGVTGVPRLLGSPLYTRPENFKGWKVPEVLLSGNHKEIEKWRLKKSLEKTRKFRPDLLLEKR
ncbi:tRNA (guanosine(37)-N1)-methyltransferase TrmD [Candidatus Woesebacteria bacterium RIFCSPLOWO2_01_FULL_39_10b]|uniref:tRNA (guanine-N(1)-)-methyltransferase n=1 Tax=Candidatus Woesebacteria bacterium RIFCSPLOWO2_01_FULL_39_10b TaxID=1802517 RepID=A0A1F8B9D8_9BACT|nr:MAG: tRNA (guanosine(37)-N1)-methyltransferase TrmD [Candidatus Woesebacteria bacterium RIFCSPLOWO2_01_FULL_39_10b]